jgi:hypothetical protein
MAKNQPSKEEQALLTEIFACADDPLRFVMFAFPWGSKGTPLENETGPHPWQLEVLKDMRDHIAANRNRMANGKDPETFNLAVASGRGIGKSSLVSWLALWGVSCHPRSTVVVTANTEGQLKSRTWAELGKWHTLSIHSHWFNRDSMTLRPSEWLADQFKKEVKSDDRYWYAEAQTWTADNPDAFAGVHNKTYGFILIMDEASGIPASIFKSSEGFFTDKHIHRYWFCFSNPRQNTGPFYECFHKNRDFWRTKNIDARTIPGNDAAVYERIIQQNGADSDEARVEVLGQFPSQGSNQFIGHRLVEEAEGRPSEVDIGAPLVLGVDVARFGNDQSVIYVRAGRDGRSVPPLKFKGLDVVQLVHRVAEAADKFQPDAICVDGGGVGGGVVDMLRSMKYRVVDVQFGSKADEDQRFQNKRAELWGRMKEWLAYGTIPYDKHLRADLLTPRYEYDTSGRLKLESKDHMRDRGEASPDIGDALAITFAVNPARRDSRSRSGGRGPSGRMARDIDYNVLG